MTLASLKTALSRPVFGAKTARGRRREKGVALILVVTSIAILLAVAVDFQYNSTVDLQLAANARDELRADYLARSAVNTSRLLLHFQKQVDGQANMLGPLLSQLGMGGMGGSINLRLWDIVPVDNSLFDILLGASKKGGFAPAARGGEQVGDKELGQSSFGDFEGGFHAEISDEEQKINLNRLNIGAVNGQAPMQQALALFADPRFEFVFEKADANGVKLTAQEVLIALHDWIDERDTQASLNVTGTGDPFPDGFGDENRNYSSRYPFRYRAKNAQFISLDELYQVDGVSDLFMSAFRDRLTVYPDKNRLLNINTNDQLQQYLNVVSVAANPNDPKLKTPAVIESILQEIAYSKLMMPFLGMSASAFVGIVERNGVAVRQEVKANVNSNRWITDKSETFTLKATGQAGKVTKTVTAVVRYNDGLGKLLYYRSE